MNKEQKRFAFDISLHMEETVEFTDNNIYVNGKEYTYEEFVSEFLDLSRDAKVGMLRIVDDVIRVLLPTKNGDVWMRCGDMLHEDNHTGFSISQGTKELDALYGLTNLNNGYFSPYGRVKLYDKSWKKIELSMDEIAEKFGVKPEQIRIKK